MELNFFTASVHYSGEWTLSNGRRRYVGGEVTCFDYCDTDTFNVPELQRLVELIGIEENLGFWFVPPRFEFDEGMEFRTDMHCRMMIKDMESKGYKDCHFYVVQAILNEPPLEDNQEYEEEAAYYSKADDGNYNEDGEEFPLEEVPDEEVAVYDGFAKWWSKVIDELENNEDLEEGNLSDNSLEIMEVDSDREAKVKRRCQFKMREGINWEEFKLEVGMEFINKKELKNVLKEMFIAKDRHFKVPTTNKQKFRAICADKGCGWTCYAHVDSRDGVTFRINTPIDEHDCPQVLNNKLIDAPWLAKHFANEFCMCPNMSITQFNEMTSNTKFSNTSLWIFYTAKRLADENMKGTIAEQYAVLYDYCVNLVNLNPGTTAKIKTEMVADQRIFQRLYICLEACKSGFRHCRQVIGLDGTFLKGFCKGIILAAIGIDADNGMFPIAWGVVEKENTQTWTWFLELLRDDLEAVDGRGFTMMSDKQKGLENAILLLFNGAEIRYCAKHLESNLKTTFPGLNINQLFWKASKSTTPEQFKAAMDEIKAAHEGAWEWLSTKRPSKWSQSHFEHHNKTDIVTNNIVESFNKCILHGREQPIIHLLEHIRNWLMKRLYKKRESLAKWKGPLGPNMMKMIEKLKKEAMHCQLSRASKLLLQVTYKGQETFVVNLTTHHCTCKWWQLSGIPCCHALSCLVSGNYVITDYFSDVYKQPSFAAQYAGIVSPMTSPDKWADAGQNVILPPRVVRMPGRPKRKRKKQIGEVRHGPTKASRVGQMNRCGNCRLEGHSRRTCKNASVSEVRTPKRMGRPPKENMTEDSLKQKQRKVRQRAREERVSQNTSGSAPQPSQGLGSQ